MAKCLKCGHESKKNKEKKGVSLCLICYRFSPDDNTRFKEYIGEKVPHEILETYRKHMISQGERQKKGMAEKASKGKLMSRAPFGYKIQNGKLVPAENYKEVEEIFEKFLYKNPKELSLRQLADKHNFSVNGLKKILRNFTYIGKIKFNNEIHKGSHKPLISTTLFNKVQDKLERLGIK